jgi:hypothetical protein
MQLQAWTCPRGFQEAEVSKFHDSRHMKVVSLSAIHTGRLYLQKILLVLISVRGCQRHGHSAAGKKSCQCKIAMKLSGIEPAIFRLVAQCLSISNVVSVM